MGLFDDKSKKDIKKEQQKFGLFSFMNEEQNKNNDDYSELNDLQKEELDKGNYDPWNFEEEDLEDDDYYNEDE